jgi:hypothetical protein
LQARLDAAAVAEEQAKAALQTRLEAAQASIADLQARIEAATRLAQETAQASPATPVQTESTPQEPNAHPDESAPVPSSNPPEPVAVATLTTSPKPDSPVAPMPEVTPAEATPPPPEPPAKKKSPKAPRRKKARRNDQMNLFDTPSPASQTPAQAAMNAAAAVVAAAAVEAPSVSAVEPPPPSAGPTPHEPEKPAADVSERGLKPAPKEEKPVRSLPAPPPMNLAELRKAVNLILPLFTGQDPGARECLKANRATFRSAFSPEAYVEFEQSVKSGDFNAALEQLKKAAKRHGIPA